MNTITFPTLSDADRALLVNALRRAAAYYTNDARTLEEVARKPDSITATLAGQLRRQSADAVRLADAIEEGEE